jgi:hypothetical protein
MSLPLPLTLATLMMISPATLPHWRRQALWLRRSAILLLGCVAAVIMSVVAATSVAYLRHIAAINASPRLAAELLRWSAARRALGGGLLFAGAFAITIVIRIDFVTPSMADGFILVGLAVMVMFLWVVAQFVPQLIMR